MSKVEIPAEFPYRFSIEAITYVSGKTAAILKKYNKANGVLAYQGAELKFDNKAQAEREIVVQVAAWKDTTVLNTTVIQYD